MSRNGGKYFQVADMSQSQLRERERERETGLKIISLRGPLKRTVLAVCLAATVWREREAMGM